MDDSGIMQKVGEEGGGGGGQRVSLRWAESGTDSGVLLLTSPYPVFLSRFLGFTFFFSEICV